MMGLEERSLFVCVFFWLAMQHVGSYFPNQRSNSCPLHWLVDFIHFTTRKAHSSFYFYTLRTTQWVLRIY